MLTLTFTMSKKKNLSEYEEGTIPDGKKFTIGIVVSEWNPDITAALAEAAEATLLEHGVKAENLKKCEVPGSYELPMGARILLGKDSYDAIICLGCVIEGETRHNEYINHAVAQTLMQLSLSSGTPCLYGVLTTHNIEQAKARAGGDRGNKGTETAIAALKMADLSDSIQSSSSQIGFTI